MKIDPDEFDKIVLTVVIGLMTTLLVGLIGFVLWVTKGMVLVLLAGLWAVGHVVTHVVEIKD